MPTKDEIILAIGAHIWWKNEFEKAISDGWHFLNPELAQHSYQPELGSWLSEIPLEEQDWEHFGKVLSRYEDFNEAAASVVRMAASGSIDLAEESIHTGSYAKASIALTLALKEWMEAVKHGEYFHGLHTMQTQPPVPNRKQPGE